MVHIKSILGSYEGKPSRGTTLGKSLEPLNEASWESESQAMRCWQSISGMHMIDELKGNPEVDVYVQCESTLGLPCSSLSGLLWSLI